jgi:hypothetical protein
MSTPFADTKTIRAAIADVLDAGSDCSRGCAAEHSWRFYLNESDQETVNRSRFMDAVIARIADLQSSTFDGVKLQDLCCKCIKRALPKSTEPFCVQCAAEQKAKRG